MLNLYNSLARKKEEFKPLDPAAIGMYVCGPTVYDRAHLGNARAVVVYDVLFRVLSALYPKVNYVRNITDVDDKINAAAKVNKEPISALTERTLKQFHDDMGALNCLNPTHEPRATNHIPDMIAMIEKLIANGNAYIAENHVLFAVKTDSDYGKLSGRKAEEQEAGARVAVEKYKRDAGDFVLWKPADKDDDASSIFDSPWGKGRPGWHIECSAMSSKLLGVNFDIHGGGADLKFPHHENEIAQSTCAHQGSHYARYWVHNGFLTVNGEKMSKSLGNFTTVRELLDKGIKGEVIRYALLSTHYSDPLDWNEKLIEDSQKSLDRFYRVLNDFEPREGRYNTLEEWASDKAINFEQNEKITSLNDNLNIAPIRADLNHQANTANVFQNNGDTEGANLHRFYLKKIGNLIGIFEQNPKDWFMTVNTEDSAAIQALIDARNEAKATKNFSEADRLRAELVALGVTIMDRPGGITEWRKS